MFSVERREPSFHQGFGRPLLHSVLWRGIAYPWGLDSIRVGPSSIRMLTSDLVSPLAIVPIVLAFGLTNQLTAEASFSCCSSLLGSYSFSSFHIRRTIAATRLAIVSLAKFGLVPADVNRR